MECYVEEKKKKSKDLRTTSYKGLSEGFCG